MAVRYNKEGLREELREALLIVPRTRGQLDGFENNGSSDALLSRVAPREITNEEGEVIAKAKAEVVRTIACRQFKQSPMPLSPRAFQYKKLMNNIHSQEAHLSGWLKYCYTESPRVPSVELLTHLLSDFYTKEPQGLAQTSRTLIKALALLACQQKRDEICGNKLLTQAYIAKISNKTLSAWEKSWSDRWRRLLSILERYDNQGLDHVYESSRSRKATRRNDNVLMQSALSN